MAIPEERQAAGESFCCDACRDVSAKIRAAGLGRFYDLGRGGVAPPSDLRPDSFAWLDRLLEGETQAAATAAAAGGSPGPMRGAARSLTLDVQGVHCAACVWLLQELFSRTPGHVSLRINPAVGRAEITWTEGQGDLRTFLREAERFGYRFGPVRKAAPARSRGLLIRLGVCAAVAMNAMIFSLSFYFGLAPSDGILYPLFGWLNLALGTVALLVGGPVFFRPAWEGVRRGLAHLDLPISLGILLAWSGSVWGHLTQGPEAAYFDSLTIFVTLMVLGRWLQERVLERNRQALLASGGVDGLTARRRRAGRLESVPASSLRRGDEIWVVAGDLVSVDGVLLERAARVSLDWIDGESRPRDVEPGAVVRAGSFNAGDSPLRVTAAQDFADSRLVDLLAPKAREDTGPPTWQPAGLHRALAVAVSILVVTCPCALGLATPLAHDLVHGALRRRGVFLRDASFLDRALRIRKLLFDKTGTLTLGRIALTDGARADLAALPGPDRAVLYNLAVRSNHPVSRAIVATMERGDGVPELLSGADPVREIPGQGLEWRRDGRTWRLGRRAFALAEAPAAPVVAAGEGAGCGCGCGPHGGSPRGRLHLVRGRPRDRLARLRRGAPERCAQRDRRAGEGGLRGAPAQRRRARPGGRRRRGARHPGRSRRGQPLPGGQGGDRAKAGRARHAHGGRRPQRRPQLRGGVDLRHARRGPGRASRPRGLLLPGRRDRRGAQRADPGPAPSPRHPRQPDPGRRLQRGGAGTVLRRRGDAGVGRGADAHQLGGRGVADGGADVREVAAVEVIVILVFISLVLVAGALLLLFSRVQEGDFEHGERLSLLPLEIDETAVPEGDESNAS
jgi:Cu2+-exporting ATPase